ncbi:hypothetical protein OSTOST_25175, partial [Ostertagia ostertagi]
MGFTTIKVTSPHQAVADLRTILKDILEFPPGTRECLPSYLGDITGMKAVRADLHRCLAKGEKLPEDKLLKFLEHELNIKDNKQFVIRRFGHGQSNPTYYIKIGGKEVVLRKKP